MKKKKSKKKPHEVKNRLLAIVRTPMYHKRVEKKKKGKGSYSRKNKGGDL